METEYKKLLRKIRSGKILTDAEMEKLPDGKLKEDVIKKQALSKKIGLDVSRELEKERKDDTRVKVLIGQAFIKKAYRQENIRKFLYTMLDEDLTSAANRELLTPLLATMGLPPLPPLSPSAPAAVKEDNQSVEQEETV